MGTLVLQSHTLVYAEAMLFVNDGQTEVMKFYLCLEQGMSTDNNTSPAISNSFQKRCWAVGADTLARQRVYRSLLTNPWRTAC